ncbi:uncharacterized protein V6R79_013788 [Siganus canaliculatus]
MGAPWERRGSAVGAPWADDASRPRSARHNRVVVEERLVTPGTEAAALQQARQPLHGCMTLLPRSAAPPGVAGKNGSV